jgi:DNA-binding NtrC family response regulator
MLGISAATRALEDEIDQAAGTTAKVLITGESGVGKEVVARLIHERSGRRQRPLVTINCAGIPESLLESELFGHLRGSFTDAHRDRAGWLERADRSTVFLDEIGEMSLRMQALLLRFLETGEIQRVGADRHLPVADVRVITATHRPLITLVEQGAFREDLYYRLNVIHIEIPPLRERREDISLLFGHFLQLFSETHQRPVPRVGDAAKRTLMAYRWPGNVRELRNVAERLVLRANGIIEVENLPAEVLSDSRVEHEAEESQTLPPALTPESLLHRIVSGESFWTVAHDPFMSHDLTRSDIRELVRLGLEETRGNYKLLVTMFNMAPNDYKKFLNFLRKYQCHVPYQAFRMAQPKLPRRMVAGV